MYMDDVKLFPKNEKELETLIPRVRIYSRDIGMEFGIEKCAMLVMKSGKRHLTDEMELTNKDKIKTLAENETYKYLGILEADTIKQAEMKEKSRKNISEELENYSRQNSIAETSSKESILGLYFSFDIPDPFSSGPKRNLNKWTKEQEN